MLRSASTLGSRPDLGSSRPPPIRDGFSVVPERNLGGYASDTLESMTIVWRFDSLSMNVVGCPIRIPLLYPSELRGHGSHNSMCNTVLRDSLPTPQGSAQRTDVHTGEHNRVSLAIPDAIPHEGRGRTRASPRTSAQ